MTNLQSDWKEVAGTSITHNEKTVTFHHSEDSKKFKVVMSDGKNTVEYEFNRHFPLSDTGEMSIEDATVAGMAANDLEQQLDNLSP